MFGRDDIFIEEMEAEENARHDYEAEAFAGMTESLAALEAEAEYNAQDAYLIAEAPELLTQLKRLVRAIDRMDASPVDGLADEARAAIAKAEGRS